MRKTLIDKFPGHCFVGEVNELINRSEYLKGTLLPNTISSQSLVFILLCPYLNLTNFYQPFLHLFSDYDFKKLSDQIKGMKEHK